MKKVKIKADEEYNLQLETEHGTVITINIRSDFTGETILRVRKNSSLILYEEIQDNPERKKP